MQFLLALGGEGVGKGLSRSFSSALLSKKGVGREGSIESKQKFDFFVLILCLIKYFSQWGIICIFVGKL